MRCSPDFKSQTSFKEQFLNNGNAATFGNMSSLQIFICTILRCGDEISRTEIE